MKTISNPSGFAPLHNLISSTPRKWIFLSVLIALLSCSKDQEILNPDFDEDIPKESIGFQGVDEALWSYFDLFELEASARGITIDLRTEDVTGTIREIDSKNVAGTCNYNQRYPNKVTIDLDFWRRSGDRGREFVTFHELGHCVLYRAHKEAANVYNVCESIMRSGTGSCIDNYNRSTRESYLDELFDTKFQGDIFFVSHDL